MPKTKLAYLLNTYPVTSGTFIRREINALESKGFEIHRFAVRSWGQPLVEAADQIEQSQTRYLLSDNVARLITAFFWEIFLNPVRLIKSLNPWWVVLKNSGFSLIRCIAYLMQAIHLRQTLVKNGITHIHVHYCNNACSVALITKTLGNISYSFTVHGPDELDNIMHVSLALKIEQAEFVVAISDFCKAQLVRHSSVSDDSKIIVIRCGIEIPQVVSHHSKSSNQVDKLICVGRLCAQKNQHGLILASIKLLDKGYDFDLQLIGDGDIYKDLETLIQKNGVSEKIRLCGWQNESYVRKAMQSSDALILPSSAEGLPIVLMESMSLAKPVISTYIAGIPELVEDSVNGFLVPAGNTEALFESMEKFLNLDQDQRRKYGRAGFEKVQRQHQLSEVTHTLGVRFKNVIESKLRKSIT